jgi:hypothetical protein
MNRGKVLIVNLSKGNLGTEPAHLLGALLITACAQVAEARRRMPEDERRDFTLYVDEFQNFATDSFASILSEARKWRLSLVAANQTISQLPDGLQHAVFGNGLRPLDYLQAAHEAVQALGVSPETAARFGPGFAPKRIMRGRFAIPVHDPSGILLAYCERAVKDESPLLLFPNGFDPRIAIFNANRIVEGDLFLVRDPLQVLTAQ